jgi:hypothetical protein
MSGLKDEHGAAPAPCEDEAERPVREFETRTGWLEPDLKSLD